MTSMETYAWLHGFEATSRGMEHDLGTSMVDKVRRNRLPFLSKARQQNGNSDLGRRT